MSGLKHLPLETSRGYSGSRRRDAGTEHAGILISDSSVSVPLNAYLALCSLGFFWFFFALRLPSGLQMIYHQSRRGPKLGML